MAEELTLLDLLVIEKMEKNTLIDAFGSQINSSFFDTAALMGTLQVKGLIEIKATIGKSVANRTQFGDEIIKRAQARAEEPLDELDHAILKIIAAGARDFDQIRNELNIRSDDLSYHLYKIIKQGYADYEIRNVKLTISLTETGFKLTGFIPKKIREVRETSQPKVKSIPQEEGRGEPEELEEMFIGEEDITTKMAPKIGKVEVTKWQRFLTKIIFYFKKYIAVFVAILIIAIIVTLHFFGFF